MVIVQAGHVGIESNCSADLRAGTGAPGERDWTPTIAQLVVNKLAAARIPARMVDANFNCAGDVGQDFAAVVAVHYQANLPTPSGYVVGEGDPAQDGAAAASARLASAIKTAYAASTGLAERPGWINPNITHYYLFEALSKATPFALIECGVGAPGAPDHDFLHSPDGMDRVSSGIARGIIAFVGPVAAPADPCAAIAGELVTVKAALAERELELAALRAQNATLEQNLTDQREQLAQQAAQLAADRDHYIAQQAASVDAVAALRKWLGL